MYESGGSDFQTGGTITTGDLTIYDAGLSGTDSFVVYGTLTLDAADFTIANDGTAPMAIDAYGGIDFSGDSGTLDDVTLNNHATCTYQNDPVESLVYLNQGAVFNNLAGATFLDESSGTVFGASGSSGQFNNAGAYIRTAPGSIDFGVPFNNSGSVVVQAGDLELDAGATNSGEIVIDSGATLGAGSYTQTAGSTTLDGAAVNGGSFDVIAGSLGGSGTINANVTSGGQVIPGGTGAAGTLTINGSYTQTATGTLDIDIGGTTAGSQYDQLAVSGTATLGGTVNVALINGFQPALGNTFQPLTFASSTGNFGFYNGIVLGNRLLLDPALNPTNLTLTVQPAVTTTTLAAPPSPSVSGQSGDLHRRRHRRPAADHDRPGPDRHGHLLRQRHVDRDGDAQRGQRPGPGELDHRHAQHGQPLDHRGLHQRRCQLHPQPHLDGRHPGGQQGEHQRDGRHVGQPLGVRPGGDVHGDGERRQPRQHGRRQPHRHGHLLRQRHVDRHRHAERGQRPGRGDVHHQHPERGHSPDHRGLHQRRWQLQRQLRLDVHQPGGQQGQHDDHRRRIAGLANVGQTVTFTATVTANAPGSGTPTGTVDFFDTTTSTDLTPGGVALSSGTATFSTTSLAAGNHTIKATYSGDGNFLTSYGTAGTVTIGQTIFVLDPSAGGALSLSGNASINIAGGVYVDSSSSTALSASGNASIKASVIDVHGGVQKSGNASFSPAPVTGAASVADPLASLPQPSTSGLTNYGSESLSGNSSATIKPGIYSAISVSGNASLTLSSGTYIIEGGGFSVSGNASVSGSGVMIVNAGSNYANGPGGTYGSISLERQRLVQTDPADHRHLRRNRHLPDPR